MQNDTKQDVIGMFHRAASLYDQVGTKRFTYFAQRLVDVLSIPQGACVLDVACGRGALLLAMAEKVGETGRVIGVDLAPGMVMETKIDIGQRGLRQADVMLMDGDYPAFRAESFDFIVCGFALHFLDYPVLLPKLLHLLKPGGSFAAILPDMPSQAADLAPWNWLFSLTKAVFPPDFTPPPAWIAPRRLNKPDLAHAAFTAAGFTDVQTQNHEVTLYFRDEDDWWDWEWSQGSRFWLEGMTPEGLERFQRESYQHLAAMKTPQGIPMVDSALFVTGSKAPA
ncbi:MAG: hypothetical protein OHK0046_48980 [Anaerolineae bacterium]